VQVVIDEPPRNVADFYPLIRDVEDFRAVVARNRPDVSAEELFSGRYDIVFRRREWEAPGPVGGGNSGCPFVGPGLSSPIPSGYVLNYGRVARCVEFSFMRSAARRRTGGPMWLRSVTCATAVQTTTRSSIAILT
jgi:hypothetical protein